MNILSTTRRLLQFSGFISFDEENSTLNFVQNVLILMICALTMSSMIVFAKAAIERKSEDLVDTFYVIAVVFLIICVHVTLMWQKMNVINFIVELQAVVSSRVKLSSKIAEIYERADKFNEKLSKYAIAFNAMSGVVFVLQWTSNSLWTVLSRNSMDELALPFPLA